MAELPACVCVCVCTADFLSRFAQTGRPHGPIKTRRVGRVSAFLGEIPHFNNHYYLSLFNVTTAVTKIASGLTSTTARLSRLTRGITVSQYLQKPLFDPVALWLLFEKAGVISVHAGLLSVNKINFSSVEEDVASAKATAYSFWQFYTFLCLFRFPMFWQDDWLFPILLSYHHKPKS